MALARLLDRAGRTPAIATRMAGGDVRRCVVHETLRLHPAAPASLRRLTEPTVVGRRRLPAGAPVLVPIPLLQRDPVAYEEPDRFRPGRFVDVEPAFPHYLPFGGGARACIGQALFDTYRDTLVPALLRRVTLRPLLTREERSVLRATILVPRRGTPWSRSAAEDATASARPRRWRARAGGTARPRPDPAAASGRRRLSAARRAAR